jgi:hypothetical protein
LWYQGLATVRCEPFLFGTEKVRKTLADLLGLWIAKPSQAKLVANDDAFIFSARSIVALDSNLSTSWAG